MRRLVPNTLLLLGVSASLAVGCDLFKPKETDAGAQPLATATATDTATPPATPGAPVTPAAPLNPATPVHPSTPSTPGVKTDGGAVASDAGKTADGAAPTPTTPVPPFPPFDAGALKGFDAGGLFRIPDGGFTPPPWPK